jgi:hypothetical protein
MRSRSILVVFFISSSFLTVPPAENRQKCDIFFKDILQFACHTRFRARLPFLFSTHRAFSSRRRKERARFLAPKAKIEPEAVHDLRREPGLIVFRPHRPRETREKRGGTRRHTFCSVQKKRYF